MGCDAQLLERKLGEGNFQGCLVRWENIWGNCPDGGMPAWNCPAAFEGMSAYTHAGLAVTICPILVNKQTHTRT